MLTEGEEILLLGLKLGIFGREKEILIETLDLKSYSTITFLPNPGENSDNEKAIIRK